MIPATLSPLANHLWQSTLSAAAVWLLTQALRKNRAAVRYGLWLAVSVKFLIPFSWLVSAGTQLGWRPASAIRPPQFSFVMEEIGRPFTAPAPPARMAAASDPVSMALFCIWLGGFAICMILWGRWWRQIRAVRRAATVVDLDVPIEVMFSPRRLEPGVFGIRKPVLLLPAGITERLTPAQLEAVIAHELCHVRRRDNLTAAIHMVVEAVFWFHPLVWWIRERLIEERERACDEEVLRTATDPRNYAEGILSVCKFYLETPLVCTSGVSGGNLKKRIEAIMTRRPALKLNPGRKLLLAATGIVVVAWPIAIGLTSAHQGLAQSQTRDGVAPAFEVASVKPNKSGTRGGRLNTDPALLTITNIPLVTCIRAAYHVQDYQLTAVPAWAATERYDIVAKTDHPVGDDQLMLMLRTLLAERFKLTLHRVPKELAGYALIIGKNGPKLHEVALAGKGWTRNGVGRLTGQEVSMAQLADNLSGRLGQPVVDLTGVKGVFDITVEWTPDSSQVRNPAEIKESAVPESASDPSGPSIFAALQQQLGLKLEPRKVPGEILVIDHVERPSEN
jgi:bla regulator protein BlaR1